MMVEEHTQDWGCGGSHRSMGFVTGGSDYQKLLRKPVLEQACLSPLPQNKGSQAWKGSGGPSGSETS